MRGVPIRNPKVSSGGWALAVQASPPLAECSRTHLYQCTSWCCCEGLHLASVCVFCRLKMFAHFIMVIYEHTCPHHAECSAVFDQKQHNPHAPPSLFTQSRPDQLFFVSLDEESPQRETICQCGRGETKNGVSTKRHQNQRVQKLF